MLVFMDTVKLDLFHSCLESGWCCQSLTIIDRFSILSVRPIKLNPCLPLEGDRVFISSMAASLPSISIFGYKEKNVVDP